MRKTRVDRSLLLLAGIGIILYIAALLAYNLSSDPSETAPADAMKRITKAQAAESAAHWLQQQELAAPGTSLDTFVVYQSNKDMSGYLEKEKLQKTYKDTYGSKLPLDFYRVEAAEKSPGSKRWAVDIHRETKAVLGWKQLQAGTAVQQGSLSEAERLSLARSAISSLGYEPQGFRQLPGEAGSPGQLVFKRTQDPVGKAAMEITIQLEGSRVTALQQGFDLPQSYSSWLKQQNDAAAFMTKISLWGNGLMALAALAYTIVRRRTVQFGRGVLLTAVFIVIYVMNNINSYPAYKTMSPMTSDGQDTMAALLLMNFVTLLMGAAVYFSFVAGEGLWRRAGKSLWPRWSEEDFGPHVKRSMLQGYLLCLFLLGLQQVLFLIFERGLGVWSINDPSTSPENLLQPGFLPLMAWAAAISEEATFRLLGIALFLTLFRFRLQWLAVLIPSLIWAAGHTAYPIYPVYTRLIEVTLLGVVFGMAFLRYGLLTVVFAHTAMNSILMGLTLLTLGPESEPLLGIVYIWLPALIGYAASWLHSKKKKPPSSAAPPPLLP
ncbi:type II CAAX prenyl endopeptidase Rce1 family protein [Paenibacillus lutrae]|uniref:CPBP family intramembrane metalloprotease n=1 Tax=Paenibacillus lutrae TaxID=2078573 RepID=A0A7X3JXL8_9BACL|nr:CPBP family intramembrane glutamic endopeptidase [Paenibacillus lutrae]MVO98025.1 CPBP family intramembrane metalloprotease [Paenibacillus lutrae]